MSDTPAPTTATGPAYAQLVARRPYLWGGRKLAEGDVVIDLRARGGAADLKVFADLLRWGAFKVEPVAGPPAQAAAPAVESNGLLARIAELEAELAKRPQAVAVEPAELREWKPDRAALIRTLAALPAADIVGLPGIGEKKAAEIQAWAQDELPNLPPMLPLIGGAETDPAQPKA